MKRLHIFILSLIMSLFASAQSETTVCVHVDGERLENLLTDEQKNIVRDLKITGHLHADDYLYLRNNLLDQLDTLNLRDADIDTIPTRAFYGWYKDKEGYKKIFLPAKLEHISDSAFCMCHVNCMLVLSGNFPTLGTDIYSSEESSGYDLMFDVSEDNIFCKKYGDCIYSADGTIAYFYNNPFEKHVEFMEGTKVIYGHAFESRLGNFDVLIPESVDSIGDLAFAKRRMIVPTCCDDLPLNSYPYLYCKSKIPPKLGYEAFGVDFYSVFFQSPLFVPNESVDEYKNTEGWKMFFYINPDFSSELGINTPLNNVMILDYGEHYVVSSITKKIERIYIYDTSGRLSYRKNVNGESVFIPKLFLSSPYSIVKMGYNNGMQEIIKLRP